MAGKFVSGFVAAICLTVLSACDTTYTGAHHFDDASTGSHLSGVETGVNANDGMSDPSIRNNAGGPASYNGH